MQVVLCGDYGVGKTSLFRRFFYDEFYTADDGDASMLGIDFSIRQFDVGDGCSAKVDNNSSISEFCILIFNYFV